MSRRAPGHRSVVLVVLLLALVGLSTPVGSARAQTAGSTLTLSGRRTLTFKSADAPSEAGVVLGTSPTVTGSASVGTRGARPAGVANVSARGRPGEYRARFGAEFTAVAASSPDVVGHVQVRIDDLRWAGELRWDGQIVDYGTASQPGRPPDGCTGCLHGAASAEITASAVDVDTGDVLATATVAEPQRSFAGATAVSEPVSGRANAQLPPFDVHPGQHVAVYVTLSTSASSRLRPTATTGAATADFGTTVGATASGKPTSGKPGQAESKGVSYSSITVGLTGVDSTVVASRCTAPEYAPTRASDAVLLEYFRAIDAKQYAQAYALMNPTLQAGWASAGPAADGAANFAAFMAAHVECVKVTGITPETVPGDPTVSASLGVGWSQVAFDARYVTPFPAGSGGFPPFYEVRADPHTGPGRPPDQIVDIATALPSYPTTSSTTTSSSSTTTTTRPATTTTTTRPTTSSSTTTTTIALSGPTAVVSLGDSFISGEAGRWEGNALNPFLSRAGTDRAFAWGEATVLEDVWTEVSSWNPLFGWFTDLVHSVVESVQIVPTYDPTRVYDASGPIECHRSDTAEVNAPIPGIEQHINLACSGAVAKNLWFTGGVPLRLGETGPNRPGHGERQHSEERTQLERLVDVAKTNQVKLIVLSIGGNDLEFSTIVKDCVMAYAGSSVLDPDYCSTQQRRDQVAADLGTVIVRVEDTIDQIRAAMEAPRSSGGAGYAPSQYRLVLQSYPSPIPRGSDFSYDEALPAEISVPLTLSGPVGAGLAGAVSNGRIALGCPFWDIDATWARDTLVPDLSDALAGVAARKGVGFLDLRDFLQDHEICSVNATNEMFTGTPSGATSEWARAIYSSAVEDVVDAEYQPTFPGADILQGDPKEAIHPNAFAQRGLQRCLLGAYAAVWNPGTPAARLKCVNQFGSGPEAVTTEPIP